MGEDGLPIDPSADPVPHDVVVLTLMQTPVQAFGATSRGRGSGRGRGDGRDQGEQSDGGDSRRPTLTSQLCLLRMGDASAVDPQQSKSGDGTGTGTGDGVLPWVRALQKVLASLERAEPAAPFAGSLVTQLLRRPLLRLQKALFVGCVTSALADQPAMVATLRFSSRIRALLRDSESESEDGDSGDKDMGLGRQAGRAPEQAPAPAHGWDSDSHNTGGAFQSFGGKREEMQGMDRELEASSLGRAATAATGVAPTVREYDPEVDALDVGALHASASGIATTSAGAFPDSDSP